MSYTIVNTIINRYLSQILDIDTSKTNSSIFSGTVELSNIRVKPTVFENLNIPYFDLVNGMVGKIKVELTSFNVFSNPIIIEITDVFILVKQKRLEEINEQKEIENLEKYKQIRLKQIDEFNSSLKEETNSKGGFIQNIINNLQITIKHIVLRFEDSVSNPESPFAFGMLLNSLYIKTTNDKYDDYKKSEFFKFGEINYKIFRTKKLSFFLDYQKKKQDIEFKNKIIEEEMIKNLEQKEFLGIDYDFFCYCKSELNKLNTYSNDKKAHYFLLYGFSFTIQLAKNEVPKTNKLPAITVNFLVETQRIKADTKQIALIFKLMSYFKINTLIRKGISKKYYIRSISKLTKLDYLEIYSKYYIAKYEKKDDNEAEKFTPILEKLEIGLKLDQIIQIRQVREEAIQGLQISEEIEKIAQTIKTKKSQSSIRSFFSKAVNFDELEEKKKNLEKEKKLNDKKIENELENEKIIEDEVDMDSLGNDYVQIKISFELKTSDIIFSEENLKDLFKLKFRGFLIKADIGVNFQSVIMSLEDFSMDQFKVDNQIFNKIVESVEDNGSTNENVNDSTNSKKAIYIELENNPNNVKSRYRLKMKNDKRVIIFLNHYSILYILKSFVKVVKAEINLDDIKKTAKKEVYKYITDGYEIMNKILTSEYEHISVNTSIKLMAPKLVIPKNIHDTNNKECILIYLGTFEFFSDLIKKDPSINYKTVEDINKIYDKYKIIISGIEIFSIDDYLKFKEKEDPSNVMKILKKVNTNIEFDNKIEPSNEKFENFRLDIIINEFKLELKDRQIELLLEMLAKFRLSNSILREQFEDINIHKIVSNVHLRSINKVINENNKLSLTKNNSKEIQMFKDKDILKFNITIKRVELNLEKSISDEEKKCFNENNKINNNEFTEFKDFLNFNTNRLIVMVIITEKKNVKFDLCISNIFLFDYDYEYIKSDEEISNVVKKPYLNKEFCCILGSINDDSQIESRAKLLLKESTDMSIDPNKTCFLKLNCNLNYLLYQTIVQIFLSKLLFNINLSTILRVYQFSRKLSEYMVKVSEEGLKKGLIETYNQYKIKRGMIDDSKINKKFFAQVKKKVLKKKNSLVSGIQSFNDDAKSENNNLNVSFPNNISMLKKNMNCNNIADLNSDLSKILEKSSININLKIKQIELIFPKEHNESDTKIFKFNFNTEIKYVYDEEAECHFEGFQLIKKDYIKKNSDVSLLLFHIDIDIIIFKDNLFAHNLLSENLMSNSRIMLTYNSYLILNKEKIVNTIDILIEPINLVIGFRQLRVFRGFYEKIDEFRQEITKSAITNEMQKMYRRKTKYTNKISFVNEKMKNLIKYNITRFNNFININVNLEKVILKLIDNTGFYDIPLTKLEFSRIVIHAILNSDPTDSKNMGLFIVEMISGKKSNNYNINNLYKYLNCCVMFNFFLYDQKLSDWEPLVEPWTSELNVFQVARITRLKANLKSKEMFNINLNKNMMTVVNQIIKKMNQNELQDHSLIANTDSVKEDNSNIVLEFKNYIGIDITFWFDNEPDKKIFLENENKFSYTQNQLDTINSKRGSEESFFTKNRFSVSIGKLGTKDNIIEGIDYSYNYFCNYKIKILEKSFDIHIKIRNSGLVKNIIFEMNIYFINRTAYKLNLKTIRNKQFNSIITENYEEQDKQLTNTICEPDSDKRIRIPFQWIDSVYASYICIETENNKSSEHQLYTDFNFFPLISKKILSYLNTEDLDQKDKILNELRSYSKVIYITNHLNEKILIIVEILLLRSILSDDPVPSSYCICFNSPLAIYNSLPYRIDFKANNNKITFDPRQELLIYYSNPNDKEDLNKLGLRYINNNYFESNEFSLFEKDLLKENKTKSIKLFKSQNQNDYLIVNIKYEDMDLQSSFNHTFQKLDKMLILSKKIVIYADYLILNKLETQLYIKPSIIDSTEIIQTIFEKKLSLYFSQNNNKKVCLKLEDSEWSQAFDISIKGIDGELCIKKLNCDSNSVNKEINLTTIITSTHAFPFSNLIIIEPRYLLTNKLPFDVYFRQSNIIKNYFTKRELISVNKTKVINFSRIQNSNDLKLIQFSLIEFEDVFSQESITQKNWSSEINVNHFEDFTIKLLIPEDFKIHKYKEIKNSLIIRDRKEVFVIIKLIIHCYDGLIHLNVVLPDFPQIEIRNFLNHSINYKQIETLRDYTIGPNDEKSFTWENCLFPKKELQLTLLEETMYISLDYCYKRTLNTIEGSKFLKVFLDNSNLTRVLMIYEEKEEEIENKLLNYLLIKKKSGFNVKLDINLKGFGVSVIDSVPREIFYISFYRINVVLINNFFKTHEKNEKIKTIILKIKNIQIDYCLDDSFKVIFYPKTQFIPMREKNFDNVLNHPPPFLNILITKNTIENKDTKRISTAYSLIEFRLQPFNMKIDQSVFNSLSQVTNSITRELDFNNTKHDIKIENEGDEFDPEQFDPILNTRNGKEIDKLVNENNMILIENLYIGALKLSLTIRIDISSIDVSMVPIIFTKLIGTVGNIIARISDSPLIFKSIQKKNLFNNIYRISNILKSNYIKQGILQMYKFLGSSDLIGNPIGFIDNVETGLYDLVNEPKKGFSKGVTQFGKGMARGVTSLVSNVVSSCFNSVSKISGSLLSATKNLQGEKYVIINEENEPKNVAIGLYDGLKGGIIEIWRGIEGIGTKSYSKAKHDGVKGFFKGAGEGLLNAAIAPISSLLKFTNSFSLGMKNNVSYFTGKIISQRFRHPRHIKKGEALTCYNTEYAEVQEILRIAGYYNSRNIIFFQDFYIEYDEYLTKYSTLIITDDSLYVCFGIKKTILYLELKYLKECKIHIFDKLNLIYLIVFYMNNDDKYYAPTKDISLCSQVFYILQKVQSKNKPIENN